MPEDGPEGRCGAEIGGRGNPLPADEGTGKRLMAVARRRGFVWPSFEIYGGSAGLWDYGPQGSAMMHNLEELWRHIFQIKEGALEVSCPIMTPGVVFEASGHVEEFTDYKVECVECQGNYRADQLIEDFHPNPDELSLNELADKIRYFGVKCPTCGGPLSSPTTYNLMFETRLGPGSKKPAYLRPETAQGIFVNFREMYRQNRENIPFGVVQIGRGYRNEISPRQGMIRLREFRMAEMEYFVHPDEPNHRDFETIQNYELPLVPANGEQRNWIIMDAIELNIIGNKAIAYWMARTFDFLKTAGIDEKRLRFRQHTSNEMAHYANDCWDAEVELYIGWTEVVGIADRSCFDLSRHSQNTTTDLHAVRKYNKPKRSLRKKIKVNMKVLGPLFKKDAHIIKLFIENLPESYVDKMDSSIPLQLHMGDILREYPPTHIVPPDAINIIEQYGNQILSGDSVEINTQEEIESGEKFIPRVIEPSFGLDRIFYAILEHNYQEFPQKNEIINEERQEDELLSQDSRYKLLNLKPWIAPVSFGIFPLVKDDNLIFTAKDILNHIRNWGFTAYYDQNGSIGRRYARMDEIGTPYCITVDYGVQENNTITIRDRNTTKQVRIPIEGRNLEYAIHGLIKFKDHFQTLQEKYPG